MVQNAVLSYTIDRSCRRNNRINRTAVDTIRILDILRYAAARRVNGRQLSNQAVLRSFQLVECSHNIGFARVCITHNILRIRQSILQNSPGCGCVIRLLQRIDLVNQASQLSLVCLLINGVQVNGKLVTFFARPPKVGDMVLKLRNRISNFVKAQHTVWCIDGIVSICIRYTQRRCCIRKHLISK